MPPKSQRSRACAECRSRRVKCDETPQICNQCRRLGLTCSGPVVGSIVIDMTERAQVVKPRARKKKEATRTAVAIREKNENQLAGLDPDRAIPEPTNKTTAMDMPLANPMFPTDRRHTEEVERAITAIRYQYKPPQFNQPSRVLPEALDTAFISHYVELNKGTKTYAPEIQWLAHLPRIHSNATKPAVRLSLRAVSMAFYGKLHNDSSILVDSWRWYTLSLSAQRTSIARLKKDSIPEEEEVLVPLILALYEIYVGATSSGSMAHLVAAGDIMNMRGPSNCRSGAIWPLFKGIRSSDAHRCIIFNKPSVYSTQDWLTLPFIGMPRDAHQSLADIELRIPHCMALLQIQGSLRVAFETPVPSHVDVGPCQELTAELIMDLNEWAATYPELTSISSTPPDTPDSTIGSKPAKAKSKGMAGTFVALIGSNYIADRLTLNMLMYKTQTESNPSHIQDADTTSYYFEEAIRCATAILKGAAEIEKAQTPGLDLLRSIAPLMTVTCCGPTLELKNNAKEMIMRWGGKIGGLASIFQRI